MASKLWSKARRIAQPFIKGFAGTDMPANLILDALKEQGMGYRRKDFLVDLRGFRRFFAQQGNIVRLKPETVVPRFYMTETDWDLITPFRYEFKVDMRDKVTGQITTEVRSMAYGKQLTKGDAERIFETEAPWGEYPQELVLGSIRLLGVAVRSDHKW